jgi:multidrug resistance efflux pump
VDSILVKEGQFVNKGDQLLLLSRRQAKETMADQEYRINQLKAEAALWREKTENEVSQAQLQKQASAADLSRKIAEVSAEIDQKKALFDGLQTIQAPASSYEHLQLTLNNLKEEIREVSKLYDTRIDGLNKELQYGRNPYSAQIKRYIAEEAFNDARKIQAITVIAPDDGLVGNINCKRAEHISSYSSLLTFYEPHSSTVKGFVHEDLSLKVKVGQSLIVSSLKDPTISYVGQVVGLGSRIVEIPARLRKLETFKVYGREVLIEIPTDNIFLQKEKVSILFADSIGNN